MYITKFPEHLQRVIIENNYDVYAFPLCVCLAFNKYEFCIDKPIKEIIKSNQSYHTIDKFYNNIINELIELNIVQILNYRFDDNYNNIIEYLEFIYSKTKSCIIKVILNFINIYCKKYYANKSALKN